MADVNLIPEAEKKEQVKQKAVKTSTVLTIILFLITAGIGGYLYYQASTIKGEIRGHEANINMLRGDIEGLSEIEIDARNLDKRYETLRQILADREYYSVLLTEFEKRIPETVELSTFGLGRESTINVSGKGDDYIAIAKFINDLSDSEFPGAGENLGGLFPDVALNSVNLDAQTDKARFFIVVTIDGGLLTK